MTVTKGMENKNQDHGRSKERTEIGVVQEKVPNPEVATNLRVEMIIADKVEIILETDLNQGPDQVSMKYKQG